MSDVALNPRGIEADRTQVVSIQARSGFVSLCTRRLPQPLGREAWLHALECLIRAGLAIWPDAASAVTAAAEQGIAHAGAPETGARA